MATDYNALLGAQMSELKSAIEQNYGISVENLIEVQRNYEKAGYWIDFKPLDDLRHVQHHLTKLLGKIAQITEPFEHLTMEGDEMTMEEKDKLASEINERFEDLIKVMPADLLIYAMHFAIKHKRVLVQDYYSRIATLMEKRK